MFLVNSGSGIRILTPGEYMDRSDSITKISENLEYYKVGGKPHLDVSGFHVVIIVR